MIHILVTRCNTNSLLIHMMALIYKLHSFTPTIYNLQLMLTLMVGLFRMAPSNMRPNSWCAVFVTWDDRCAGAWAGARARAGAATLTGDGAWAGAGAATLAGDGAWKAGAGSASLQYPNRLCCAGDLVTGGGEGATRGVSQSTSMTCKIQYE